MSSSVRHMFARIAPRYDVANDVLSFGVHRLWRRAAVRRLGVQRGMSVLDLCTGTGDFAFTFAEAVGPEGRVVGLDFVEEMIGQARRKLGRKPAGIQEAVEFVVGDAMQLPFADRTFDVISVAFGIRNVDEPQRCLREMKRVLKPGGRALVLEFGRPTWPLFSQVYRLYSSYWMPAVGGVISGDREAYEYLPRTSREFPDGANFASMMKSSGFDSVSSLAFLGGVAYAYFGSAPEGSQQTALSGEFHGGANCS